MQIKPGVSLKKLQPQMVLGAIIVDQCFGGQNLPCVVTAGDDGTHMKASLHYKGLALDFRTSHVQDEHLLKVIVTNIKARLGGDYDVVLEGDHLHVEWDQHGRVVS